MDPFLTYLTSEQWAEPVPPITDSFMAEVDFSLMEQIFDVTE